MIKNLFGRGIGFNAGNISWVVTRGYDIGVEADEDLAVWFVRGATIRLAVDNTAAQTMGFRHGAAIRLTIADED